MQEAAQGVWVTVADGSVYHAAALLLAVDPQTAARLLPNHEPLQEQAETAVPVRAAVLDVALRALPQPKVKLALGIDEPTYLSVHSAVARLAPNGGALIHVARYLAPGEDGRDARTGLEAMLNVAQPGWQDELIHSRFLSSLTVVNRLAAASEGGLSGRLSPQLTDRIFLAGDWIGSEGWLADASFASARAAAEKISEQFSVISNQLKSSGVSRPAAVN